MSNRLAARAAGPIPLAAFWNEPKPAPPKRRKLEPLVERRQTSRRRSTPIPAHELPTREEVMRQVAYCPETGAFTRKHRDDARPWANTRYAGKPAGAVLGNGYVYVRIGARQFLAHRLAWLIVHGEWPANEIDHVSGVTALTVLPSALASTI